MAENILDETNINEERNRLDDLSTFREQWKREIGEKLDKKCMIKEEEETEDQEDDIHVKAREYFLQGVKFEENGKLYEAIRFYKKAEKLVPNIEYQTFKYTGKFFQSPPDVTDEKNVVDDNGNITPNKEQSSDKDNNDLSLAVKFGKLDINGQGGDKFLIKPAIKSNSTHIGCLPNEVINYILKWVISSDLDVKSLECCSEVCRGFYLAARDEELWKLICINVWEVASLTGNYYNSWREMFMLKPRVQYNGCYSSKISYIRAGEKGFQDNDVYKPWHVVEYYRFLRFFPGGQCVMATSADDEAIVLKQLSTKNGCKIEGAMFGSYKIVDSILVCVLQKPKQKKKANKFRRKGRRDEYEYEVPEQDYHLEFYIKGPHFKKLHWKNYNIVSKYKNGSERVDQIDMIQKSFPVMKLKSVGSYHFESSSPLK